MRISVRIWVLMAALAAVACSGDRLAGERDGARLYHQLCARCHGGDGVPPPAMAAGLGVRDLSAREAHERLTDDQIHDQIWNGSPKKGMPGFGGAIDRDQVRALVEHVRTLAR